ncbi:hypothetical protein MRB53_027572 [Persea americana]|uniref:Uncharacterized protein n=1 Tax=Persea americana TaxID=3435 RepID=A0ACC2LMH3_PERAE|nr:hypothetical protein MRB53_027572 [Persea americana]
MDQREGLLSKTNKVEPILCGLAYENNPRAINPNYNHDNVALYMIVLACRIEVYPDMEGASHEFEIYSLDKKRWQLLGCASEPHPGHCKGRLDQISVCCNQFLYWQCSSENHALVFNLETETSSGYLELPRDHA